MTPHSHEQLMPSLPDRYGYATVRLPGGDKAVITRVPRDQGTSGRPDYRDTFYLHTPEDATRYALQNIRRIQETLEPWTPHLKTDEERKAFQKAEEGETLWSEALGVIGACGSKDQADAGQASATGRRTAEVSER
jgi:hypothetical protein